MKFLSVAVPCYNVEKYLDKCLSSFSDERFSTSLEVLIVNDGSNDRTEEIARKYVENYPEIFKLINKENGGHGSAVNAGVANATGKYFRIVDGDDWINTENMVDFLSKAASIETDLIIDEKTTVNMVSGKREFFPLPQKVEFGTTKVFLDFCDFEMCDYYALHTLSVKLDLIKEHNIKLREHIFYVDYEFIVKVTAYSQTVTFLDLDIYRYLIGNVNQSVDSQNYVRRFDHHRQVVDEVLRFVCENEFEERRKEYLYTRVRLIINTHYKIALIYNTDRKNGMNEARKFRSYLKNKYKWFYNKTNKRFFEASILHYMGVNANNLDKYKRK